MNIKERAIRWIQEGCLYSESIPLLTDLIENYYYKETLIHRGNTPDNMSVIKFEILQRSGVNKADLKNIVVLPDKDKKTIRERRKNQLTATKQTNVNENEEVALRLREQFSFLNDKNCIDEFKILVADMITAYHLYIETHPKLFDCTTKEECFNTGKIIIDNYILNRKCWEELHYYKTHGKILGEHELFKEQKWMQELKATNKNELNKLLLKVYPNRIWQNNKKIKDEPDNPGNDERRERIAEFEKKIEFIKIILNC